MSHIQPQNDTIERTSIVAYGLFRELHEVLSDPRSTDDVTLGIVMGLGMFLDDKIGPMRAKRLLEQAPTIVLKTDAHVTPQQTNQFMPVLHALGEHLRQLQRAAAPEPVSTKVI